MGFLKYKESAQGEIYHIYNRGNNKKEIFIKDKDYRFFLKRLKEKAKKFKFSIIAYCLMPNHFHLILKQNDSVAPSKLMSSIITSYSMVFNLRNKTVGHLFQDRYKQKIIRNEQYLLNLIAYIHLNPVKDGLCRIPKDYIWSSHNEYAGYTNDNICDQEMVGSYNLKGQSFQEYIQNANFIAPAEEFDN